MGDEFYCSLKLISGEEIFSLIIIDENNGDPIIILQSPIMIEIMETPMGSFVKVNPWMKIPNDDFFMIKLDKVITMTEITDQSIIQIYNRYLNDESDNMVDKDGKVKLSNQMGYISSVQEARARLEKLLKDT